MPHDQEDDGEQRCSKVRDSLLENDEFGTSRPPPAGWVGREGTMCIGDASIQSTVPWVGTLITRPQCDLEVFTFSGVIESRL